MQQKQARSYKLDLLISKRRRQTLTDSANQVQIQQQTHRCTQKSSQVRKMIFLTVGSKGKEDKHKVSTNPQTNLNSTNNNIAVSEFKIEAVQSQHEKTKMQNESLIKSVRQNQAQQESDVWWKYLKYSEDESRAEMLKEFARKQKKIQFFIDLLKANSHKFQEQKKLKVAKYESYLNKLKQLYSEQILQASKLFQCLQQLEQKKDQQFYHQLRLRINRDGKRGLNFSPKRMSLLPGINDTLLLSKKTSGSQQKRRSFEQFSFGSSLRKKSNDATQMRSNRKTLFLDEGRISIYKKRLNFKNT